MKKDYETLHSFNLLDIDDELDFSSSTWSNEFRPQVGYRHRVFRRCGIDYDPQPKEGRRYLFRL